jgi:putative transposase
VPVRKFTPRERCALQAYRYALDPTPRQARALSSHVGAARFAYNWAVALVRANWAQRRAEESYGIPDGDRIPWHSWSLPSLRKQWNEVKDDVAPWWAENSKEAYSSGLACASRAFDNYAASKRGERKGQRMGRPRVKRKRRGTRSCRFTTGTIRVGPGQHRVTLPRLGTIRTHESTRKLERRLACGKARILSATVRQESDGRWFVSFHVEAERETASPSQPRVAAGVDLGLRYLAVVADSAGQVRYVENPQHLGRALRRLRQVNRQLARRQGPALYDPATGRTTRQKPSKGWQEAVRAAGRVHARVRHLRADGIHKLTTATAAEYGQVVVEDLNVAGMMRHRRMARHISDAGFGEIRRQLAYKTNWYGGTLMLADRWFPSSKTCSGCGAVKAKLSLSVRVFRCQSCGLVRDRDHNAAANLAALAASMAGARSGRVPGAMTPNMPAEPTVRPAAMTPVPAGAGRLAALKQEPGTVQAGKTGTASPQGLAAGRVLRVH